MEFIKYQHVERFGNTEVEGIELGRCYIFPKIDGTNASIWVNDKGEVQAGSRKRHLSLEQDNAGFYKWVKEQSNIQLFFKDNPDIRLYGEWLVPHTLKTYSDNTWNKFYVFDVMVGDKYLTYEEYKPMLETYEIDYIPAISIIENGTYERFIKEMQKNTFLIEDGKGIGEGVIIKNYGFKNKYGRQTWAKIVSNEFKDKHIKEFDPSNVKYKQLVEDKIVHNYVTKPLCEKVKAKIEVENNGFSSKYIPRLLHTVYYDLIKEESWNFIKKYKNPTINYKTLQYLCNKSVREHLPTVF